MCQVTLSYLILVIEGKVWGGYAWEDGAWWRCYGKILFLHLKFVWVSI